MTKQSRQYRRDCRDPLPNQSSTILEGLLAKELVVTVQKQFVGTKQNLDIFLSYCEESQLVTGLSQVKNRKTGYAEVFIRFKTMGPVPGMKMAVLFPGIGHKHDLADTL